MLEISRCTEHLSPGSQKSHFWKLDIKHHNCPGIEFICSKFYLQILEEIHKKLSDLQQLKDELENNVQKWYRVSHVQKTIMCRNGPHRVQSYMMQLTFVATMWGLWAHHDHISITFRPRCDIPLMTTIWPHNNYIRSKLYRHYLQLVISNLNERASPLRILWCFLAFQLL